ncbi:signal peptidase I [Flaviflexus equikiangi]|uniref:Signal peptidase I n=1 Tax=Flaviflexus equikiangi TaxID=2758573 RepID=A0ABS2TEC1_9ACTO|nr:signal peptidase I [Flaviflexus equikiangi]MBM9433000.1 signal peptidase I [Flaviflexus equikiangi]
MAEDSIPEGEMPPSYAPEPSKDHGAAPGKTSVKAYVLELVTVIAFALVVSVLIKTFLFQAFYIPSSSMTNTLEIGDRIIVNKLADSVDDINRGDIVVFVDPGGWLDDQPDPDRSALVDGLYTIGETIGLLPRDSGQHLVKRVIGVGGDEVECCSEGGEILVNGVPIDEPYIREGTIPSGMDFHVIVPSGHLWVMGDNRSNSEDSRAHMGAPGGGFVPVDNVEGRVSLIMYPLSRFGGLGDFSAVFEDVPSP